MQLFNRFTQSQRQTKEFTFSADGTIAAPIVDNVSSLQSANSNVVLV